MNKTFLANVIIHSFATAHAIAAAALAQTLVGDEATLTALTIAMIIALSKLYQAPLSWGGTRGATCLIKWVPGIGNTANALSTIFTTEVLGWATVYLLSRGRDLSTVRKDEANHIIREGKALRKKNEAEKKRINNIVNNKMTSGEKALYHSIMEQLKDENISDSERENLIRKLDELFKKHE